MAESSTEIENSFGIGLKLQTYMSHSEFNCGKKIDASIIHSRYDRGSQFIDFNSSGLYSLKKQTISYDVSPNDFKSDISGVDLTVNYGYYILDNFAVGAGLGFNTTKTTNGMESTTTEWNFIPNLTFNLPVNNSWNNLFLSLEGGMGSSKTKFGVGLGSYNYKEEFYTYSAYLGFNYLLSSQIALTPKLGYSFKNIDNSRPSQYETRTPNLSFGFRYIF